MLYLFAFIICYCKTIEAKVSEKEIEIYNRDVKEFASCPEVILDKAYFIRQNINSLIYKTRTVYKIMKKQEKAFTFNISYDNKKEVKVKIYKIRKVDNKFEKELINNINNYVEIDERAKNKKLFSSSNTKKTIFIYGLEKDDIIQIEVEKIKDSLINNGKDISYYKNFHSKVPIINLEVNLILPKNIKINFYSKYFMFKKLRKNNFIIFKWKLKNIDSQSLLGSNFLSFSTFSSWKEIEHLLSNNFISLVLKDKNEIENLDEISESENLESTKEKLANFFKINNELKDAFYIYNYLLYKFKYRKDKVNLEHIRTINDIIKKKEFNKFESLVLFSFLLDKFNVKNNLGFIIKHSDIHPRLCSIANPLIVKDLILKLDSGLFIEKIALEYSLGYNKSKDKKAFLFNNKIETINSLENKKRVEQKFYYLKDKFISNNKIELYNHIAFEFNKRNKGNKSLGNVSNIKMHRGKKNIITYSSDKLFKVQDNYFILKIDNIYEDIKFLTSNNKIYIPFKSSYKKEVKIVIEIPNNFKVLSIPKNVIENFYFSKVKINFHKLNNKIIIDGLVEVKNGLFNLSNVNILNELKDLKYYIILEKLS